MKIKFNYILPVLFMMGLLTSCTEPIDLELNDIEGKKLVVDAMIDNRPETDTIILSLTSNYYDPISGNAASGASVSILNNGVETIFEEMEDQPGYYLSPDGFIGSVGETYQLNIIYGEDVVTSTTEMKFITSIDTLTQERLPENDFFDPYGLRIKISFQDPPGEKNFYWLRELVNGKHEYENLAEYGDLYDDFIVDGEYLELVDYDTFDTSFVNIGDTLTVEAMSLTEPTYNAISAYLQEAEFRGGFFDPPPANVPTNVEGNGVGLFIATAIDTYSIVITE